VTIPLPDGGSISFEIADAGMITIPLPDGGSITITIGNGGITFPTPDGGFTFPFPDGGFTFPTGDAGSAACTTLSTCCATLAASRQNACKQLAASGFATVCQGALTQYKCP
jgi:hypothetical protein